MCGIAGIYNSNTPVDLREHQAAKMAEAIAYRGPDAQGVISLDNCTFAHRRLSIIDLDKRANQPMCAPDGSFMLSFNGEIYNYRELRASLSSHGYTFRTTGDTEVIMALYAQGGSAALSQLDGMFAIAIYDTRSHKLILMRDRLGKKPLYYLRNNDNSIIFGSTLAALQAHDSWQGKLRMSALHDFLSFEYVPGNGSVFENVYKVPPATIMHFQADGQSSSHCYWQLDYSCKLSVNIDDAAVLLREKIQQAVARRLLADVPCGIFLSGGIDSAIIAMEAARQSQEQLRAFTIGFDVSKYDETHLAAATAAWVNQHTLHGLSHHIKTVDCRSLDTLKSLIGFYGEPFADFSMLPTYFLSEFASRQVKLVLSGDGADELFGGYERYQAMRYCAQLDRVIPAVIRNIMAAAARVVLPDNGKRSAFARLRRFMQIAAAPANRRYADLMLITTEKQLRKLYGSKLQEFCSVPSAEILCQALDAATTCDPSEIYAECDLHNYLEGDILVKVDRASMANSLEVRSPFLDTEVVELAARLPFEFKQNKRERKKVLKMAMADSLSPQIIHARKRGFAVPVGSYFRGTWQEPLRNHLLEGQLVRQQYLNKNALEQLINEHTAPAQCHDHTEILGSLFILELFLESTLNK